MELLRALGRSEVMIKIEALFEAYLYGIEVLGKAVDADPTLDVLMRQRGRKLFADRATFP